MDELALHLDTPSALGELARLAFAWSSFEKATKRASDQVRRDLHAEMERNGVERQAVKAADGDRLGTVAWNEGRTTAKVTDEQALTDWVAEHFPTEVHQVTRVRERFLRGLLEAAAAEGIAVHAPTGEVIPGVAVNTGEPFIRITEARTDDKLGDQLLAAALQRMLPQG